MRLTIEKDNGTKEVFNDVTDLYIAVTQATPVFKYGDLNTVAYHEIKTKSFSWGPNIRELVKEVQQSLFELQDFLRGSRNVGSS